MDTIGQRGSVLKLDAASALLVPLQQMLPVAWIVAWLEANGYVWRDRLYTPTVSLLACILKQMGGLSARKVEDALAGLDPDFVRKVRDGKDFCMARLRLPLELFLAALRYMGGAVEQRAPVLWHGLHVWMVDGTTASMPRTPENLAHFGVANNQYRASHFPLLRAVLLVGAGVVLDAACGVFGASELALFVPILQRIPAGGVWIGDSLYGSYLNLALTLQRGSHVICGRNVGRRQKVVTRLSRYSHLERWTKPRAVHCHAPDLLVGLPDVLDVRVISVLVHRPGFRDYSLVLYTTLLDVLAFPDEDIVAAYLQRWNIELDIRTLKTEHGLDHLTAKCPDTVRREFVAILLAFNAVRTLQAETGQPVRRLSHTRSLQIILDMSLRMSAASPATRQLLHRHLLLLLATVEISAQRRLPQPRAVVRNRRYPHLSESRSAWRAKYYAA